MVLGNLRKAFPEKKEKEIRSIARRNYRNFIDNWIETIKLLSISKKNLNKRISGNFEIFFQLFQTRKAVQVNRDIFLTGRS